MQTSKHASRNGFVAAIVESGNLLREGLAMILSAARFKIVIAASELDAKAADALRGDEPALLIIGMDKNVGKTITQIELFKENNPTGLIAALVDEDDARPEDIAMVFRAGANTCLSKHATGNVLIKSLELLLLGERVISQPSLRALLAMQDPVAQPRSVAAPEPRSSAGSEKAASAVAIPPLSVQEKRILRCLVEGDSNKSIARKFEIAEATVKVHLKAILRKIRLQNRTQAAVWALNNVRDLFGDDAAPSSVGRFDPKKIAA